MAPNQDVVFDSKPVFSGIPVSGKWLAELVQCECGDGLAKLIEIKARRLDEDQGYCSIVAKLDLKWSCKETDKRKTSKTNLPTSVIIKLPSTCKIEELSEQVIGIIDNRVTEMVFKIHNVECRAYKLLTGSSAKSVLKSLKIPRIFGQSEALGQNSASFLLMEDLSGRGRTPDFVDGLTVEQCKRLIDNIAMVQAYSIANPTWNVDSNFQFAFQDQEDGWTEGVRVALGQLMSFDSHFLENIPFTLDEVVEKIYNVGKAFSECTSAGNCAVLVHGDLWINNLLFGADSKSPRNTTDELIAIIDWQGVYSGWCTADISRMLISSMDWKLRRENEEKMLEYYYDSLLAKLPGNVQPFHSLEEVKRLYFSKTFRFNALGLTLQSPLFLNQKQAKEKYSDKELTNFVRRVQAALEDTVKHLHLYE